MSLTIALGQFNALVGDIGGNIIKMSQMITDARGFNADIVVFPEMCVCGYPPEDLLYKKHFLADNLSGLEGLAKECAGVTVIAGFAEGDCGRCFNSLAVLRGGRIVNIHRKGMLPNYGVFDEKRYFESDTGPEVIDINGVAIGLTICEEIWQPEWLEKHFKPGQKRELIINISASPFHAGKLNERYELLRRCAEHFNCAIGYCNLVGGQDELVFDGRSMFLDSQGQIICQAKAFSEDMLIVSIEQDKDKSTKVRNIHAEISFEDCSPSEPEEEIYGALVLGTGDYVRKNGFEKVIIGLSGGIDSSLVACVAADALGAENVVGVTMPSRFNSLETISDSRKLADNLGIEFKTVTIESVVNEFSRMLGGVEGWDEQGLAYENLQARVRGTILMSLSNQFGFMVLTTGNKSETAVGYSTLYGDTAGGFAVIKDVPKTMVYRLSRYVNDKACREIIPASVIERAPSAELRENQKDSDSLPDYDELDRILKGYIELNKSAKELIEQGEDKDTVSRIIGLVDRNEYKRRQSPPGVKITPRAFGKDRRMPITNRYRQKIV